MDTELGSWSLQTFRGFEAASLTCYPTLLSIRGTANLRTTLRWHARGPDPACICGVCDVLHFVHLRSGGLVPIKAQPDSHSFTSLDTKPSKAVDRTGLSRPHRSKAGPDSSGKHVWGLCVDLFHCERAVTFNFVVLLTHGEYQASLWKDTGSYQIRAEADTKARLRKPTTLATVARSCPGEQKHKTSRE